MKNLKAAVLVALVLSTTTSVYAQNRLVNPGNFLDGKTSTVAAKEYSRLKVALERSIEIRKTPSKVTIQFVDKLRNQKTVLAIPASQLHKMNPFWRRIAAGGSLVPFVVAAAGGAAGGTFLAASTVFYSSGMATAIFGSMAAGAVVGGIFAKLETMITPLNPGHQWERSRIEKEIKTAFGSAESVNVLIAPRTIDEYDDYRKHIEDLIHDLR